MAVRKKRPEETSEALVEQEHQRRTEEARKVWGNPRDDDSLWQRFVECLRPRW